LKHALLLHSPSLAHASPNALPPPPSAPPSPDEEPLDEELDEPPLDEELDEPPLDELDEEPPDELEVVPSLEHANTPPATTSATTTDTTALFIRVTSGASCHGEREAHGLHATSGVKTV
jgi:hypothetical protein